MSTVWNGWVKILTQIMFLFFVHNYYNYYLILVA
jgi:hypothetical protein